MADINIGQEAHAANEIIMIGRGLLFTSSTYSTAAVSVLKICLQIWTRLHIRISKPMKYGWNSSRDILSAERGRPFPSSRKSVVRGRKIYTAPPVHSA